MKKNTVPLDPFLYYGSLIMYAVTIVLCAVLAFARGTWWLLPLALVILAYYTVKNRRAFTRIGFEKEGIRFVAPLKAPVLHAYDSYAWVGAVWTGDNKAHPAFSEEALTPLEQENGTALRASETLVLLNWDEKTREAVRNGAPENIYDMLNRYGSMERHG